LTACLRRASIAYSAVGSHGFDLIIDFLETEFSRQDGSRYTAIASWAARHHFSAQKGTEDASSWLAARAASCRRFGAHSSCQFLPRRDASRLGARSPRRRVLHLWVRRAMPRLRPARMQGRAAKAIGGMKIAGGKALSPRQGIIRRSPLKGAKHWLAR
jgi:hypothetical protein